MVTKIVPQSNGNWIIFLYDLNVGKLISFQIDSALATIVAISPYYQVWDIQTVPYQEPVIQQFPSR